MVSRIYRLSPPALSQLLAFVPRISNLIFYALKQNMRMSARLTYVMDFYMMKKLARVFGLLALITAQISFAQIAKKEEPPKEIKADISIPYERPIGFTINVGSLSSLTFEGRFHLGLINNLSLVLSPSFQKTMELPFYHLQNRNWSAFDIKRFNLGVGIRGHFYEYDSRDGLFIEGMGRFGMTWAGADKFMWSIIPSLIFGYTKIYDSGYTVSFGVGVEWEALIGKPSGKHSEFLKTAYYGLTKIPLTGELSLGWMW